MAVQYNNLPERKEKGFFRKSATTCSASPRRSCKKIHKEEPHEEKQIVALYNQHVEDEREETV